MLRKVVFSLMVLFAAAGMFAQANEVYTEIGSDVISKEPVKDADVVFGGFYNKTLATLVFDKFWVDAKIGVALYSNDEWDSSNFGILGGDTHLNVGFMPMWHSEVVVGTDYDRIIPGTYLYAYDDVLPNARFGNTGATYVFSGLKPLLGISMAVNVPFQYLMFTDDNGFDMNAAVYYESDFGINVGSRMFTDFEDNFSIGGYVSGGLGTPFFWMAGYTYKGVGYDSLNPADHYLDGSFGVDLGFVYLAGDFEIGFKGVNDARPLYTGILAKINPLDVMTAQLGVLYSVSNTKDYDNSYNALTFKPKVLLDVSNFEIGIGADITVLDSPVQDTAVGLAFPVHVKYWF